MKVFRLYVPGDSFFHRLPVSVKYLIMLLATFVGLMLRNPFLSLAILSVVIVSLIACRVGLRHALRLPWGIWVTVALLLAYQFILGSLAVGVVVCGNLIAAIYASRILTMTTPGPVLIDALVSGMRILRFVKVDPERVGLAIALMMRSIPVLLDSFEQVQAAARARGRERNLFALLTPFVVRAVGYAQATGQALRARGLEK